ncbi:MAG: hypothetical protein QXX08_10735 [Candidatus Bathyarchaeia archaeon]
MYGLNLEDGDISNVIVQKGFGVKKTGRKFTGYLKALSNPVTSSALRF